MWKIKELQSLLVLMLLLGAAVAIGMSAMNLLRDPSSSSVMRQDTFAEPDQFNKHLNQAKRQVATLQSYVASSVPLQYVGPEESFAYYQAVVAPQRIGADIDSPYIFFCSDSQQWLNAQPAMQNTALVALLFYYGGIARKGER